MKRNFYKTVAAIAILLFAAGSAIGADATLGVDMNSAYVWRGLTFNDGLVAQPSLDVTKGGFGVNVWGNYDIDDYDDTLDEKQFSEIDLTVSYGFSIESVDLAAGYIEYTFPSAGGPASREVYASISGSPMKGLSVGLDIYYEFESVDDYYMSLSVAYGFDINDDLGIEIGASAGYMGEDYAILSSGGTDGGLHEYNIFLSASYAISDAVGISANINRTDSLDDDVLPDETVDVTTYGGASISYAF